MANLLTRVAWQARLAELALPGRPLESRALATDLDDLVTYMLFARGGAAGRAGRGRLELRPHVRGSGRARPAWPLAARPRPADAAVPLSAQLPDRGTGVRGAADRGARGDLPAAARGAGWRRAGRSRRAPDSAATAGRSSRSSPRPCPACPTGGSNAVSRVATRCLRTAAMPKDRVTSRLIMRAPACSGCLWSSRACLVPWPAASAQLKRIPAEITPHCRERRRACRQYRPRRLAGDAARGLPRPVQPAARPLAHRHRAGGRERLRRARHRDRLPQGDRLPAGGAARAAAGVRSTVHDRRAARRCPPTLPPGS